MVIGKHQSFLVADNR